MHKFRVIVIVLILLLVACDQEDDHANPSLSGARQERSTATATMEATSVSNIAEDVSLSGKLLYLEGDTLFMSSTEATAPLVIAKGVSVAGHSGETAVVRRETEGGNIYTILDFSSLEETPLLTLPEDQTINVTSWSPDDQYFTVEFMEQVGEEPSNGETIINMRRTGTDIYGIDGQQLALPFFDTRPDRIPAAWLDDGSMIIVKLGNRVGESFTLWHYDPTTTDAEEIEVDPVHQPALSRLDPASWWQWNTVNPLVADYGLRLAPSTSPFTTTAFDEDNAFYVEFQEDQNRLRENCREYWLMHKPLETSFAPRNLYTTEALNHSRPLLYGDYVYFIEVASPSCVMADVQVSLVRVNLADEAPVAETVYTHPLIPSGIFSTINFSQYGDYMLWTVNDSEMSRIVATDLSTGATGPVFEQPLALTEGGFPNQGFIRLVLGAVPEEG